MNEFDLDPSISWLFVFAHPDDELAIATWIRRLTLNGNKVSIAWIHGSGKRGEEARKAAESIGVNPENCYFADFDDGSFLSRLADLQNELRAMLGKYNPDRLVCAAFEQGHLDHDALRFAIEQVWDRPVLEFPEYWPYTPHVATMNRFTNTEGECVLELSSYEKRWKHALAKNYPSTDIWRNLFWYEIWSALRLRRAHLIRTERLRWSPKYDFRTPRVPEKYNSKVLRSNQWKVWLAALDSLDLN